MSQTNVMNVNTFRCPPPPPPPPPPAPMTDQQFLKSFEARLRPPKPKMKASRHRIWDLKDYVMKLIYSLQDMKLQHQALLSNYDLSDEEWNHAVESVQVNKRILEKISARMNKTFVELKSRLLRRRLSKRRSLKRRRQDHREYKRELIKRREENSRRINENLQKIQEDIQRAKKADEAKKQADMVLKDVLRRKTDAKKSIAKLDALMELRRARVTSARGQGQVTQDNEAFNIQIEKLKALWIYKLSTYEVEEEQLRAHLQETQHESVCDEKDIKSNLARWLKVMFGSSELPQYDFKGDVHKFIQVRREWDQFIDNGPESTPMPIGWVLPDIK